MSAASAATHALRSSTAERHDQLIVTHVGVALLTDPLRTLRLCDESQQPSRCPCTGRRTACRSPSRSSPRTGAKTCCCASPRNSRPRCRGPADGPRSRSTPQRRNPPYSAELIRSRLPDRQTINCECRVRIARRAGSGAEPEFHDAGLSRRAPSADGGRPRSRGTAGGRCSRAALASVPATRARPRVARPGAASPAVAAMSPRTR